MSIRIHELAKKIGMDNKELLALLKERKFDVRSVSSTIDNISADALVQEFGHADATGAVATAVEPPAHPVEMPAAASATGPSQVNSPTGVFVKSVADIAREKADKVVETAKPRPPVIAKPAPLPPPPPAIRHAPPPLPSHAAVSHSTPVSHPAPVPHAVPPPPPVVKAPASVPPLVPRPLSAAPKVPSFPVSSPAPVVQPSAAAPAAPVLAGDVKLIQIKPPIIVRDFAAALGMKPFKLISELNQAGGFASMNSTIEESIAVKVAEKHGFMLEIKHRGDAAALQVAGEKEKPKKDPAEEEAKNLMLRPPVVCILGHVDHGKTSLLDAIRKADVAAGEAGGITQHIGAYQIERNGRKITFLDTPGHAAFTKMRARGADVTDIAVLVVAADDGFMPQTDEALKHAQNAGVALIVAINKTDVKGANIEQVKGQMQQRNIAPEDWGGETITVPVSAIKGDGIDNLLEMILLQADVLELKANPKAEASGVIVESEIDFGRGPLATIIVQRGTLRTGDAVVCGHFYAKVRAMFDDQGRNLKEAPPSTPVRVIGWSGPPESGASFKVVKNSREAERLAEEEEMRIKQIATREAATPKEVSVEQLFANIAATQAKTLKVIIKTDVFGSAEAVRNVLEGIKSTKISLEIVATEVGLVTKNDVLMASAAGAVIIGFHTRLEPGVTPLAKHHGVRIESFEIIYELGDKVRDLLADLLDPELKEVKLGGAEVRQIFPLAKGFVAGCLVTEGKITRNAAARLRRKKEVVHEGKIATLKRFKDDANEVRAGLECGIKLDDFNGYEVGDLVECYEIQKVRASL
ncbi:MAG: translation initiation factor IF-2 [Opitutales bacterium]